MKRAKKSRVKQQTLEELNNPPRRNVFDPPPKHKRPKEMNPKYTGMKWYHQLKRALDQKPHGVSLVMNGKNLLVMETPKEGDSYTTEEFANAFKADLGRIIDYEFDIQTIKEDDDGNGESMEKGIDRRTRGNRGGVPGRTDKS